MAVIWYWQNLNLAISCTVFSAWHNIRTLAGRLHYGLVCWTEATRKLPHLEASIYNSYIHIQYIHARRIGMDREVCRWERSGSRRECLLSSRVQVSNKSALHLIPCLLVRCPSWWETTTCMFSGKCRLCFYTATHCRYTCTFMEPIQYYIHG